MKNIQIVILTALFLSCFSASIKRKTFLAQNQDLICEQFANATFRVLNEYRTQNGYGQFAEWDYTLMQTANQQAKDIIANNNFGQHALFYESAKIVPNEYFSEITVRANIQAPLPTEDAFATELLQNILEQNNSLLQHEYTHGAVVVYNIQQENSDANTFVIVIHLIKKQMFENCLQAKQAGDLSNSIEAMLNGQKQILYCDQTTDNGGWTLIADVNEQANGKALIVPIDDKGLFYTELLFVKKPEFNFGYWTTHNLMGFANTINYWRFDTTWFYQGAANPDLDKQNYSQDDIQVLQQTMTGDQVQQGFFVADSIIFKNLPQNKRVNAFSDSESVIEYTTGDNHYNYAFYLYVR